MTHRVCKLCKQSKPVREFHGSDWECRVCAAWEMHDDSAALRPLVTQKGTGGGFRVVRDATAVDGGYVREKIAGGG